MAVLNLDHNRRMQLDLYGGRMQQSAVDQAVVHGLIDA
jgi:hypothetical protein